MNRIVPSTVLGLTLAATSFVACGGDNLDAGEIVRIRDATTTECADGGQTILVGKDTNDDGALDESELISTSPVCNGSIGETGPDGIPGTNALILTAAEAAGANCAAGGVRLDVGIDDDRDGTLQMGEIDATSYICDGAPGLASLTRTSTNTTDCGNGGGIAIQTGLDNDGNGTLDDTEVTNTESVCNGSDGEKSLVIVTAEAPGANCTAGGQRIESGIDENQDDTLTGAEIANTAYVCNPVNNLVSVSPELAGTSTNCPAGGSRIQVGLDTNANGTLDAAEVTQTSYSCTGANGTASLVAVTPEAAGANCINGGQRVDAGVDGNTNGTLEAAEIVTTSYVCDGANGADGAAGSLARVSVEPAGANCVGGGSRIESGPDTNGNGVLDAGEITATSFACDGAGGLESLVTSTGVAPGPDCVNGGVRIDTGLDLDRSGTLEVAEVTSSAFVCNGAGMVPFAIQTAVLPDGTAGQPYSAAITAAGGTGGNYMWSISAGTLPNGLVLQTDGTPDTLLSGSPVGGGTFTFTVQVTDFFNQVASREFTITVAAPILAITTFVVPSLDPGVAFSATMGATGGSAPYTWSVRDGTLPTGIVFSAAGVFSGTPTVNRNAEVLVRVTDNAGDMRDARIKFRARRNWVGFSADATTDAVTELYVSNISSGTPTAPVAVNPTAVTGQTLGQTTVPTYTDAKFSPSGNKVAFVGDFALDGAEEIWFVDLDGATPTAPVRANTPPFTATTQDVDADDYFWSEDGRWLAFIADDVNDSEFNLFVIDTDAATPTAVRVNAVLPTGSDVDTSDGFRFSPDGTRLAYISDEETSAIETLYVVNLTAPSSPIRVSSGAASADIFAFVWTPDSTTLIYAGDDATDGFTELFMSNVSGALPTAPVRVNGPITNSTGDVGTSVSFDVPSDFSVSPDGTRLYYIADARTESIDELYVVDLATPGVARLVSQDGRTSTADDVDRAFFTPDSQNLIFVGDTETSAVLEVFLTDATGLGSPLPVALNAPFATNGDVSQGSASFSTNEVVVDRNNRGVFFMADGLTDAVESLFFSSFSTPGTMTNLAPNLGATSDVNSFLVSEDGGLVVWNGDPTASAVDEVYAVNTAGATFGAPARVNGASVTGGDVDSGASSTSRDYDIVGDGIGVIYIADELTDVVDQPFFTPVAAGVPGTSSALITPVTSGDTYQVYR